MLCFHKRPSPPPLFEEAVLGISTYAELDGDNHRKMKALAVLLDEQGCLCPFCERRISFPKTQYRPATIDHFLPQSRFPEIQINYFNLLAICTTCNGPKSNHLIPAYFYDRKFCAFSARMLFATAKNGRHGVFHEYLTSGTELRVHGNEWHDALLQNTIYLLNLNDTTFNEPRGSAYGALNRGISNWNSEQLLGLWQKLRNGQEVQFDLPDATFRCKMHEEFLSLKMEVLKNRLRKTGIQTAAGFREGLGNRFVPCLCE